jgi:hypothetical protein
MREHLLVRQCRAKADHKVTPFPAPHHYQPFSWRHPWLANHNPSGVSIEVPMDYIDSRGQMSLRLLSLNASETRSWMSNVVASRARCTE